MTWIVLNSGMSHSYSTHRDKNLSRISRGFDDRTSEPPATLGNQVILSVNFSEVSMPYSDPCLSVCFSLILCMRDREPSRICWNIFLH